jgi:hypothetical protein
LALLINVYTLFNIYIYIYIYIYTLSQLEIRAKQFLLGREGVKGMGVRKGRGWEEVGSNDPNKQKKLTYKILFWQLGP